MFVTTFLRSMPQGVAARKGYEQLVAGGRVPGDIKSVAVIRRTNWREAVKVLDLGIASVLRVSEVRTGSTATGNGHPAMYSTVQ